MHKFWQMKALAEGEAEILIYEFIGYDWWTDTGVTAKQFAEDLKALGDVSKIILRINSPGGEVFDGNTIYNLLKSHKAYVETHIDGIAASIASVIALAGDKIIMPENAMMMVHNPWGVAIGEATDMRKMADALDKIRESILATYRVRTGLDDAKLIELMDAETWLTAADAVELGFADEETESVRAAASFKLDYFRNVPQALREPEAPVVSDDERRIRAARLRQLDLAEAELI